MGSFVGSGNQYIQLVKVLYCKLPTKSKKLPTSSHKVRGLNLEASVLPLCPPPPPPTTTTYLLFMAISRAQLVSGQELSTGDLSTCGHEQGLKPRPQSLESSDRLPILLTTKAMVTRLLLTVVSTHTILVEISTSH